MNDIAAICPCGCQ